MKPKISLVSLGVADLDRETAFYRDGLGLPIEMHVAGEVTMFRTEGTLLALYVREKMAEDLGMEPSPLPPFPGFTLAHNVPSREAVDELMAQAEAAGARVLAPGRDAAWGGYIGHFADPEGFPWEIAWNPGLDLT
ncbi:MAG: VOC family protein [Hyphomicrobiales bacterium]